MATCIGDYLLAVCLVLTLLCSCLFKYIISSESPIDTCIQYIFFLDFGRDAALPHIYPDVLSNLWKNY